MKTMTKEQLAEILNGRQYREETTDEIVASAKENNLVIIFGYSDDNIEFCGTFREEVGVYGCKDIYFTRGGIPESDCEQGDDCPYFQKWFTKACKSKEVRYVSAYWCGEELHDSYYKSIGKPDWYITTALPHASFNIYEECDDEPPSLFCIGIVIDLDEIWPQ